jgi:hypothetical protein
MSKLSRLDMKQNKKHKKPIHERDRKRKRKKISSFFRNGSIASASASIDAHNHLLRIFEIQSREYRILQLMGHTKCR